MSYTLHATCFTCVLIHSKMRVITKHLKERARGRERTSSKEKIAYTYHIRARVLCCRLPYDEVPNNVRGVVFPCFAFFCLIYDLFVVENNNNKNLIFFYSLHIVSLNVCISKCFYFSNAFRVSSFTSSCITVRE